MTDELSLITVEASLLHEWKASTIRPYFIIKGLYSADRDNVLTPEFQQTYANYYGMMRFTTPEFRDAYFKLLHEGHQDLEYVLRELHKYPAPNKTHRIEFSFATKLLNTLDSTLPIYDANVDKVIRVGSPWGDTIDARIASCLFIHDTMKQWYALRFLGTPEVIDIIIKLRELFPEFNTLNIPDERILDLVLWKIGSRLKKRIKKNGSSRGTRKV